MPSQEAVCLERSLDLDLPAFSRWHGYGTLTGHWLSLSLSFPDRGAESWTISRVCSSSPSSGFDSDCLCPTPDSILVTSLLPQSLGLEVSPYFLASWDLTLMVGFCGGLGAPNVPLSPHLVSANFLHFKETLQGCRVGTAGGVRALEEGQARTRPQAPPSLHRCALPPPWKLAFQ